MSALSWSLRACSLGAASLGVAAIAAAILRAPSVDLTSAALPDLSNTLLGTVGIAVVALVVTTPLSVGAATWRVKISLRPRRIDLDGVLLDALRALPAVLVGALVAIALRARLGEAWSLAVGVAAMVGVNLASYVAHCEEALRAVPLGLEESATALGASQWFTLRRVTWPAAARGIVAAALRANARLLGECVPLVLALGAVRGEGGTAALVLGVVAIACALAARSASASAQPEATRDREHVLGHR